MLWSRVSPSQPGRRSREAGRVKEFPAGNVASSGSRMAFLKSLCSLPKYRLMVDLIQLMVRVFFFECFLYLTLGIQAESLTNTKQLSILGCLE